MGPLQVLLTMQAAHFAGPHGGGQSWEDALESMVDSLGEHTLWGARFATSRASFQRAVVKCNAEHRDQLWGVWQKLFPPAMGSTLSELHGIRFAHVDGTQVRMARSDELVEIVGVQDNGPYASAHYPNGKCVLVLEAGTQRILGHELCRCKAFAAEQTPVLAREERDGWRRLRDKILENHGIIADCGFASYDDFADMIAHKQHFLIAIPKSWKLVRRFAARKQSDAVITMPMPTDPERTLTIRVFTITDGEGKRRYIATSLNHPFTLSECRRLYKTRWSIETWFRYAKQFLATRRLRSTTLNGVRLEILAILTLMHAIAALRTRIAHKVNSITDLLSSLRDGYRKAKFSTTVRMVWHVTCTAMATPGEDEPPLVFWRLMKKAIPYRPGRRFKRISKDPSGVFMPKRPSRSQRKSLRKRGLTR